MTSPASTSVARARARALLVFTLTAFALSLAFSAVADAGTYTVWSCRGPANAPVPMHAWEIGVDSALPGDVVGADTCATGGYGEMALASGVSFGLPVVGSGTFNPPAGTTIANYSLWRSLEVAADGPPSGYNFAAVVRERTVGAVVTDYGCFTTPSGCAIGGNPNVPLDLANEIGDHGVALSRLQFRVACLLSTCNSPAGVPARLRLFKSRVAVNDPTAPSPPALSGPLATAGTVSGVTSLQASATDVGGGISSMRLVVDGNPNYTFVPDNTPDACQLPYTLPRPCPLAAQRNFTVDTAQLPEGAHTGVVSVTDAGGNTTSAASFNFTVTRPPVVANNGNPAVTEPALSFSLSSFTHRRGKGSVVTGSLRTSSGSPIAGAVLTARAFDLFAKRSAPLDLPIVTTGADGGFSFELNRDGAFRVELGFAPLVGSAPTVFSSTTVKSALTLTVKRSHAKRNKGQSVTLSGALLGGGSAGAGATVNVQAIVHGKWKTVAKVRTGSSGRYKWTYRFKNLTRDARIPFRTVVPKQGSWPWAAEASNTVKVLVNVP